MAFFLYFLEIWPLLLWKFGLGSYARLKIHWCLAARFTVQWIKTTKVTGFKKRENWDCQSCVYRRSRRVKPINHKIEHNFQDQTSTAKVAISPKNIGKMPQNLLKKIFWKINFIKMIKILICVLK